jgi:RNA polymerase sigma-70 factor (ECF subfamily)
MATALAAPGFALPRIRPARSRSYAGPVMPDAATERDVGLRGVARDWVSELRETGPVRDAAIADLHDLLLRGARHELHRRARSLAHVPIDEIDDLATQAADDALMAVLAKLDTFRGASRFTTWAYKFVLLEAGVKARRRAWHDRELPIADEAWARLPAQTASAQRTVEESELLSAIRIASERDLTDHQREVFTALALNEVPIDVLAERLETSRGALYKTLHDARRKLRSALASSGYFLGDEGETGGES